MTKTRNKLKIMGLVLTLLLVLGMMPLISITADAADTIQMLPFKTTITVNCECGKDVSASGERVSYSSNGATWTYDIKVEWWCSACYKNYSYTCSGISVTSDDCEKGTPAVTVTENLSSGATINFKFWRDAGEHASSDITTSHATCISTGEKRVDKCRYCGLTKTLETYPIDAKNHSFVNGFCELCGAELHVCSSYDNGFCTEYGCYEPAELKDGYYQIKNAGQLYWFAGLVNGTLTDVEQNASANAVLMDDITVNSNVLDSNGNLVSDTSALKEWTQIGDSLNNGGFYYQGTFDGQGYTVSGLYHNSANKNVALVGSNSGTVCNVTVANSYFKGSLRTGGIVGWNEGSIYNCASIGCVLDTTEGFAGGIASVNTGKIYDCYNTSAVSGTLRVGGICGTIHGGGTVTNCYNIGAVTSDRLFGGIVGTFSTGEVGKVENCYFNSDVFTGDGVGIIGEGTVTNVEGKTTEQFASGEVAYLLGDAFGQNVDNGETVQTLPVFFGTTVYAIQNCKNETQYSNINQNVGHKWVNGICTVCNTPCDHKDSAHTTATNNGDGTHSFECSVCVNTVIEDHSTTADGDRAANCGSTAYCSECDSEYGDMDKTNHDETVKYENGFCPNCDVYEPATINAEGYYEIDNAGQLFWFAQQVNVEGNREIKGVLTADIDLENRPWTPIGETGENNKNFRGVFDGQNHTIKGLYVEGTQNGVGFFGEVRTGTVKNFTIYGEVIVNTEVDYVGGVIGSICGVNGETDLERNGAIIQNITSYVNLTAKVHGVGMIGGFVGYANHQSLIENCSWYGTFDAGIYRVDSGAGGFIGKIQENTSEVTIRNCGAYGTIKTNYAGDYNNTATIYMGGFLSFSNTNAQTTLENCLFAGKFERGENLTDQAFLGAFGTLRSVNAIKNCYYLGDGVLEAVHSNSDLKPGSDNVEITSVTKAQLLSGEVAYKLGEHFGQTLEGENRQSYPVLGGTKVEDSQRFEIYGQQLNIGGDLSMKYYVMGYAPAFNSGALYMEFSHNGVKTKVYAGEPNADGFYVFVLEGINPQCMGDSIRAMLYYNETEVASHGCEDGKEYSVEKNLLNLLEKYKDDAALVALIKDTLAYGEAASVYKKHQTMTGNTYTENSSNREIPVSEAQVADVITGYTVRFGTAISIIIEVNPSAFEDTIYKVECNGTELRNFPSPNSPLYKVSNIAATDFDKEWEFVVRSTNPMGDVYGTVVISVNDYLYAISQSTDASDEMKALAKALYNYGVSAKEYAASQNN